VQKTSVSTSIGEASSDYVGTVKIRLTNDAGVTVEYAIPDAVYDPKSPFNILGIPFLGQFFGASDSNPSYDDDGTWVKSSATRSHFVWDHGRHERHFQHDASGLPVLCLSTGVGYFQSFCTRVQRRYSDRVHYAFSSAHSLLPPEASLVQPTNPPHDPPNAELEPTFLLGQDVLFHDGQGLQETVVYEGATPDGRWHTIRRSDGSKMVVPDCHLRLFGQPDFSNVPSTPLDYRKEVGIGITQQEAQELAYPRILSPAQQELLSWHNRLCHLPFSRLFQLARWKVLPTAILQCEAKPPLCVACQFGQAHRRPWRTKGKASGSIRRSDELQPGDGASVDQIVSAQPGLIPQMAGFPTSDRIWGTTNFCDHVSGFVYVHLMRNFTLEETLSAKRAYEKLLHLAGRTAKHYHADNGRFADKGFHKDINDKGQSITFCGVGAHHQNGIIENRNKQLTLGARTLLLHGMRHWPQMIDILFWPFAMKAMAERMNSLHVDDDGNTPESLMHGVALETIPVRNFHTLFCPVYVLDHRLQSAGGPGPPKWEPRSRIGVYLGHSPFHAGSVALVFNPKTARVSPQYHVIFDDDFSTVPYMERGEVPPNWDDLCRLSAESATDESIDLALEWMSGQQMDVDEDGHLVPLQDRISNPFDIVPDQHGARVSDTPLVNSNDVSATHGAASEGECRHSSLLESFAKGAAASLSPIEPVVDRVGIKVNLLGDFDAEATDTSKSTSSDELLMPERVNLHELGLRRSKRVAEQKSKGQHKAHVTFGARTKSMLSVFALISSVGEFTMPRHRTSMTNPTFTERIITRLDEANEHCDGTLNEFHFVSLLTDTASNEVFTYHQAQKQPDWAEFVEAMEKEIEDHESRDHWELVPRATITPGNKPIKAIWSFKRKRFPDGRLNKHKARICAHGGMQRWGENYWETYSPVVNMISVKLLLVIAKIHGLESKSIDFVLAFPQADLDVDIWMELPIGFQPIDDPEHPNQYVLKLKKNLYGLKQASYNWYGKLRDGLVDRGFTPSKIDQCLYMKKGMVVLVYVDDCIIVGDDMTKIDQFVASMQTGSENFILTDEGSIDKFLGIDIKRLGKKEFEISQPFLVNRILQLLDLDHGTTNSKCNEKFTPAASQVLNKDTLGKPRKRTWNYRTAVGMLSYLQNHTRPDISMPVHQTARFCNDPKLSHEQAINRIGKYLAGTRDRGIRYKVDSSKGLECYVDADFAGGWNQEDPDDAGNLMSRTGFVIKYADCPIYWSSKLQTEIALSTAEAEYIALSSALREVIPLMTVMDELNEVFPLQMNTPDFFCKVWEDNQSCISMATSQKFTPRTKHIALKYHHFKQYVESGRIKINYVHTEQQQADILTKPVRVDLFPKLRYMLMGW
jgi:hypothetical protein